MPQLLLPDVTPGLLRALGEQAALHGLSEEEELRRILQNALFPDDSEDGSLMEFLLSPENPWPADFEIPRRSTMVNSNRRVDL